MGRIKWNRVGDIPLTAIISQENQLSIVDMEKQTLLNQKGDLTFEFESKIRKFLWLAY